jgi:hypothetical protein
MNTCFICKPLRLYNYKNHWKSENRLMIEMKESVHVVLCVLLVIINFLKCVMNENILLGSATHDPTL